MGYRPVFTWGSDGAPVAVTAAPGGEHMTRRGAIMHALLRGKALVRVAEAALADLDCKRDWACHLENGHDGPCARD